ncbi:MAG: cytochrome c3 family protein [Alphaproteobacteria bacterium]|nr:cytochrome c3 family protein [Alphaproteobacteria bacterium]
MLRSVSLMLAAALLTSCMVKEEERLNDPRFPLEPHLILPVWFPSNGQVAAGATTGQALDQPLPFSHYLHATKNQIDCEYCHVSARNSIHGGVPQLATCMNCHKFVRTKSPNIKKLKEHFDSGTPLEWNKVHDLPDYVHFAHNRHVRAGVQCTECHGQIQLQGQPRYEEETVDGETMQVVKVDEVMIRETTLQMGWCLDCHAGHPSIDQNYGDNADLRRAELKDCWTCHK